MCFVDISGSHLSPLICTELPSPIRQKAPCLTTSLALRMLCQAYDPLVFKKKYLNVSQLRGFYRKKENKEYSIGFSTFFFSLMFNLREMIHLQHFHNKFQ